MDFRHIDMRLVLASNVNRTVRSVKTQHRNSETHMRCDVVYFTDLSPGWAPLDSLAILSARVLNGTLIPLSAKNLAWDKKLVGLLPRRKRTKDLLLAILRNPTDLYQLRSCDAFRSGYRYVAVWMFDGFWHEWSPSSLAYRDIDLLAVMRPNDIDFYKKMVGKRVIHLGWGSDVLIHGSGQPERSVDVQRMGRQPAEWDSDDENDVACARVGLTYAGRPPLSAEPQENLRTVREAYTNCKFVLANSNLASPAVYTHPSEEYITARWTDALSAGAIVAGVQPSSDRSFAALFWPGATLDFDRVDRVHNLAALAEAKNTWTPNNAKLNFRNALLNLDWRWRLKKIAQNFELSSPFLDQELSKLNASVELISDK